MFYQKSKKIEKPMGLSLSAAYTQPDKQWIDRQNERHEQKHWLNLPVISVRQALLSIEINVNASFSFVLSQRENSYTGMVWWRNIQMPTSRTQALPFKNNRWTYCVPWRFKILWLMILALFEYSHIFRPKTFCSCAWSLVRVFIHSIFLT